MLVTSIFSFSHNVFKRLLSQGRQKSGLCGKELMTLLKKASENNVGKEENTADQHFLISPPCLPYFKRYFPQLYLCQKMLSICASQPFVTQH